MTEWHDPYLLDNSLDLDHIFTAVGDPNGNPEEFTVVDATYLQFLPKNRRMDDQYPYAFVGSRAAAAELIRNNGGAKAGFAHSYSLASLTHTVVD